MNKTAKKIKVTDEKFKDARELFLTEANTGFELYIQQREDQNWDETLLVLDGMWRCFRSNQLSDTEVRAVLGVIEDDGADTEAHMGSIRQYRQVSKDLATLVAMINAQPSPFKYNAVSNPEIFGDTGTGKDQAAVHTVVAEHSWVRGGSPERVVDWALQVSKYGNAPVRATMSGKVQESLIKKTGQKKHTWQEVTVDVHPDWEVLHIDNVYADFTGGNLPEQELVLVVRPVFRKAIYALHKAGHISEDAYKEFTDNEESLRWDGTNGADLRIEQQKNQGGSSEGPTADQKMYLVWEIYKYAQIGKNGEVDEEMEPALFMSRVVGNSLGHTSVMLSMESRFDPDQKIPITMTHAGPDDSGMLYHFPPAVCQRAMYAIESYLWGSAIDNTRALNSPPVLINTEFFQEKPEDFRYADGKKYLVSDINRAIKELPVSNQLESNARMIGLVQDEQQVAGNSSPHHQGQGLGSRAGSTEALIVNKVSRQPELVLANYAVKGFLRFVGRNYYRYAQAFMPQELIEAIANEMLDMPLFIETTDGSGYFPKGTQIFGEFDIDLSILDEFEQDSVAAQRELNLMGQVSANPALRQSDTHKVDFGEWLKSYARRYKIADYKSFIISANGGEGARRQRDELRMMLDEGLDAPVDPQADDHEAHLREIDLAKIEYAPVINGSGQEGIKGDSLASMKEFQIRWDTLVIPHEEQHKMALQAVRSSQEASAEGGLQGTPQAPATIQTEGQESGNIAGEAAGAGAN